MTWSSRFEDPIALPDGRELTTLRDAADYIKRLPKAEHDKPHWQTAIDILIKAAEGRDFLMHARIGMLQALNFGKVVEKVERRKRTKSYRIIP
jgi:hypothetical protein